MMMWLMFLQDSTMSKRFKYFISALFTGVGFYLYLILPVESRYFGLMLLVALTAFCFWFGLGIVFEGSFETRIMAALLPIMWTLGYGLFTALLPINWLNLIFISLFFGAVIYVMFLVENVFLVAIGYKTVPLYRAAYTVSLMTILLVSFLLFDSMFSFHLIFWVNMLISAGLAFLIFNYQYWAIAIELPDDGKEKGRWPYILIPSLLLVEMVGILSFWPVGVFKGSVYLVAGIYVVSGLIQAEIRDRLYRGVIRTSIYMGAAVALAAILVTNWG